MLGTLEQWPVWTVVISCGFLSQLFKLVVYSVTKRHFDLALIAQGRGLPSLQATSLSCLLVLVVMRFGWHSGQASFALVFAVIVIHDTVKLRVAASRQREVVYHLVASLPDQGQFHQRVAGYLDPRRHQVSHVAMGMAFGALFGLAFGSMPG
jgi:acid phosphatase family membrane protein YuiD